MVLCWFSQALHDEICSQIFINKWRHIWEHEEHKEHVTVKHREQGACVLWHLIVLIDIAELSQHFLPR